MPAGVQRQILSLPPAPYFVVENQQAYGRGKSDPNDLIRLAHVAGAAAASAAFRAAKVLFPLPKAWKAGVPKGAHQARFLDYLGWEYEFDGPKRPVKSVVVPEDVKVIGDIGGNWSEVVDAMALAVWGYEQLKKEQYKEATARLILPPSAKVPRA